MEKLAGFQRKHLRGLAHDLKPIVHIGTKGLTPALLEAVSAALMDHELIKIKFLDFKEEKKNISEEIAAHTQGEIVGLIGNIAVLYREHPDPERREIAVPQRGKERY